MLAANVVETAEQLLYYYVPSGMLSKIGPCAVGLSATAVGLYLGSLFTDDDSITELQKHLDKESYLQEMKTLFLKRDQFSHMQKVTVLSFTTVILLAWIVIIFLACKIYAFKNLLTESFIGAKERIHNIEQVAESILKDHEVLDIRQYEFLKAEIEQQRNDFKSFITNRSLDFETTVSDAKTSCLRAKSSVHTDLKKFSELMNQASNFEITLAAVDSTLQETKVKAANLSQSVHTLEAEVDAKMESIRSSTKKKLFSIEEELRNDKVEMLKCNTLFLCSQTLFEAAVYKLEEVESLKSGSVEDILNSRQSSPSEKILSCLKKAVELTSFLESDVSMQGETSSESHTEQFRSNFNDRSINVLLFDLIRRLELIEEKTNSLHSLINGNDVKIKHLENSTSEKISDLKYCSDEWITSWVSVIYGLFNSSFLHIENQLFGIDCLEYTTIFDIANDKVDQNSNLFYEIMDKCKQSCLKIVKEINLLIFEFYLVQGSISTTNSSLLALCNSKIDDELDLLFLDLQQTVERTALSRPKLTDLLNTLVRLRHDLTCDLRDDTRKFNVLVKQNLEDFCIIHDTMKTLFKETETKPSQVDDESVIEITDHSNSLLSLHEDSSFSENDNSSLGNTSDGSLRPFKLSVSKQKK